MIFKKKKKKYIYIYINLFVPGQQSLEGKAGFARGRSDDRLKLWLGAKPAEMKPLSWALLHHQMQLSASFSRTKPKQTTPGFTRNNLHTDFSSHFL